MATAGGVLSTVVQANLLLLRSMGIFFIIIFESLGIFGCNMGIVG